jgi:hypothetical protein
MGLFHLPSGAWEKHGELAAFVDAKREQLQAILQLELLDYLGCGYFGCAVDTPEPWVVKFTTDEAEVDMWVDIIAVAAKKRAVWWGIANVKEIVRLKPNVAGQKVWAIVREKVEPLIDDQRHMSERTRIMLGLPVFRDYGWDDRYLHSSSNDKALRKILTEDYEVPMSEQLAIFEKLLAMQQFNKAIYEYERAVRDGLDSFSAYQWTTEKGSGNQNYAGWLKCKLSSAFAFTHGHTALDVFEGIYHALFDLAYYEVYLGDLNFSNIGWRLPPEGGRRKVEHGLVIYDPRLHTGVASGSARELPERLVQNRGRR